ncbi:ABC transporter permease [Fulvivirga sp.]|uniref:ABC transporter permease n=1 Tax=Fulvivirga sp. TaxID=1931237 RepID=UPI0032EFE94A
MTSQNRPPKFAQWLLNIFCRADYIEDLIGDLDEEYAQNLKSKNRSKAAWLYYKEVFSLILSYALVKRKKDHSIHPYSTTLNNIAMLKNYFKVAIRSLRKQPLFTIINVLGLSAGMSIGILFLTMISFVQTYDNFHEKGEDIFRIVTKTDNNVNVSNLASTPAPLAEILNEDHSGFGKTIRINKSLQGEAEYGLKKIPIAGLFVDDSFLDVFSFDLLEGSKSLEGPYSILITQSYADKLFSNKNPIGETINLGNLGEFIVKGILKDVPKNSHMWFEALVSYETLIRLSAEGRLQTNLNEWESFRGNYTYMQLPKNTNMDDLNTTLNQIAEEKYKNIDQFSASFKIQPLSKVAMGNDFSNELGTAWGTEIYLISVLVTLLILLPACFNYANISTARALSRAKEIGMRKVVGGVKKQIFFQFILETMIVSLISLIGAFFIFSMIRYEFQSMLVAGSSSLDFQITPTLIGYAIIFATATGILAGIFPAIHFAGIKPIAALKKTAKSQVLGKVNMQKSLLVIQFALSFGFIMGVVVFLDQYRTMLNYDFGFRQENVLDIPLRDVEPELLRASLDKLAAVQQVSMSSRILGVNSNESIWVPTKDDSIYVTQMFVDHNYLDNLELEFVAGSGFEQSLSDNEQFAIVNEEFVNRKGFANADVAIGESVQINDSTDLRIAGVVKNFHFQNLSQKIYPLMFRDNASHFDYANVKIISDDVTGTLAAIETEWQKLSSEKFESKFFADEIDDAFDIYSNVVKILSFMGFLAITISCLGLLGMVVFSTQSRTKEVGIRKVMGAPIANLTYLLTKDFFKLMLIGSLISIPISYMLFTVMITQQNAYSTGIGVFPVILSLLILFVLGTLTVMSQTWKAANANPTDTLRYE